jgi:hypothetical protein
MFVNMLSVHQERAKNLSMRKFMFKKIVKTTLLTACICVIGQLQVQAFENRKACKDACENIRSNLIKGACDRLSGRKDQNDYHECMADVQDVDETCVKVCQWVTPL